MKVLYIKEHIHRKSLKDKVKLKLRDIIYYAGTGAFYTILHFAFKVKEINLVKALKSINKINRGYDLLVVNWRSYSPHKLRVEYIKELGKKVKLSKILYVREDRIEVMPDNEVLDLYDLIIKEHPYKDLNKYNISEENKRKIYPSILISPLDRKVRPHLLAKFCALFFSFTSKQRNKIYHKLYDVFFIGRASNKNHLREKVWKNIKKENFKLAGGIQKRNKKYYFAGIDTVKHYSRKKYFKLLKQSKVNLAIDGIGAMTHRHYEIMGLEEFMISSPSVRDFKFFINEEPKEGIHFVVYDNLEDLISKIKYYLNHPKEREIISKNAKKLYDQEYNIEARAREFRNFVKNKFNIKDEK
jgi:hypothetical protein